VQKQYLEHGGICLPMLKETTLLEIELGCSKQTNMNTASQKYWDRRVGSNKRLLRVLLQVKREVKKRENNKGRRTECDNGGEQQGMQQLEKLRPTLQRIALHAPSRIKKSLNARGPKVSTESDVGEVGEIGKVSVAL
jgi:hypothetical protein